jgi:thioredoxin reductase (NADPH)
MGRYRRSTLVIHDGQARALRIPKTHNAPGFPDGICGTDLIERMSAHAEKFGVEFEQGEIVSAKPISAGFEFQSAQGTRWQSRTLLLATGIILNQVALEHDVHEEAINNGILRYCPVCDAHEHIDTSIGVIGCDSQGAGEAMFLRRYSANITLVPQSFSELTAVMRDTLEKAGITVVETPLVKLDPQKTRMNVFVAGREESLSFDVIYPALGSRPRSGLAASLGIALDENGNVGRNAPFKTSVAGLFCAGDIVEGLDQISVAIGHGAIAATKAHTWLRECDGEML